MTFQYPPVPPLLHTALSSIAFISANSNPVPLGSKCILWRAFFYLFIYFFSQQILVEWLPLLGFGYSETKGTRIILWRNTVLRGNTCKNGLCSAAASLNAFVCHLNVLRNLVSTNLSCFIDCISLVCVLDSRHPELHGALQWALPLCFYSLSLKCPSQPCHSSGLILELFLGLLRHLAVHCTE